MGGNGRVTGVGEVHALLQRHSVFGRVSMYLMCSSGGFIVRVTLSASGRCPTTTVRNHGAGFCHWLAKEPHVGGEEQNTGAN